MKLKPGIYKVSLDGTEYPVSFNMIALGEFCRGNKIAPSDIGQVVVEADGLIRLFSEMFRYGHRRMGKECDMTDDDIADLVGMNMEVVADAISHFFPSATPVNNDDKLKKFKPRMKVQ